MQTAIESEQLDAHPTWIRSFFENEDFFFFFLIMHLYFTKQQHLNLKHLLFNPSPSGRLQPHKLADASGGPLAINEVLA